MFDLPVETWQLRIEGDPFVLSARRIDVPADLNIAEALAWIGLDIPDDRVAVGLGGHAIPRTLWRVVRPKPGQIVEVRGVPSGIVAGIIAGAAAIFGAGGGLAAGAVASVVIGTVAAAGIAYGVRALSQSLFAGAPSTIGGLSGLGGLGGGSGSAQAATPRRFGIGATSNELRPNAAVPMVLGRHRMTPPYGAAPYTEVRGDDQFLRAVFVWGYGPLAIRDERIGNTPLARYSSVSVQHDPTGTGQTLSLYPKDVSQENLQISLSKTFDTRSTGIETDEIGVTVTFPGGLFELNDEGTRIRHEVTVEGEYRIEGGPWRNWFRKTYRSRKNAQIRDDTHKRGLTRGVYEIRIRRTTAKSTDSAVIDEVVWSALRGVRNEDPVQMEGVAKSAILIRATNQINNTLNEFNAEVALKLPVWNGAAWTGSVESSNPAAIYRWLLTGPANRRPLDPARIDDANLGDWFEHCEANGYEFNAVIDDFMPLGDLLNEVAAAGFASPRIYGGRHGVVIERPQSVVVQHFTPRNSWGFAGEIVTGPLPHALRIQFANSNRRFRADERIVYDDGQTEETATRIETMQMRGVTKASQVYQLGRHFLATRRLRPERFVFRADVENLICRRGDLIRISHDVALIGQATGRVVSVDGTEIVLDEPVAFQAGKSYALRVRTADAVSKLCAVTGPEGATVTVTADDSTGIAAGDLWMFGETGQDSLLALVKSIEYEDDLAARLVCVAYSEAVYSAADQIPPYQTVLSEPLSLTEVGPPAPEITNVRSDESALPSTLQGDLTPMIRVNFDPGANLRPLNPFVSIAERIRFRWRESDEGGPWQTVVVPVENGEVFLGPTEAGVAYDIEAQAEDAFGGRSEWTVRHGHIVVGFGAAPPPVATLTIDALGTEARLAWTYPAIPGDVSGFEIRYHPDAAVTVWQHMTRLTADVPRAARSFAVPHRSGSYAIKPIDIEGNRSDTAVYVNSALATGAGLNAVEVHDEAPAFGGTKLDVVEIDGDLQLRGSGTMADWTTLAEVERLTWDFVTSGSYVFGETDLGAVYTSRVSVAADVRSINLRETMADWITLADVQTLAGGETGDEYGVALEVSWSAADSGTPDWGPWQPVTASDITARWIRFRGVLTTADSKISPVVNALKAVIDMPDRIATGSDVASGAGTKTVNIAPPFRGVPSVTLAAQNMASGDTYEIGNKTASSFDVVFRDSGGTPVDRTFDWQAVGYGREHTA